MKTQTLDYCINIQKQEKIAKRNVMIYLPSSTFSILSTLNDTREIQQLQMIREEASRTNIYLEEEKRSWYIEGDFKVSFHIQIGKMTWYVKPSRNLMTTIQNQIITQKMRKKKRCQYVIKVVKA